MKKITKLALTALSLTATVSLTATSAFAQDGLKYDNPYARATPTNAVNSAIFMTIENHMKVERTVVSAESDAANIVELHTVEKEGDIMKMRQIEKITLPADSNVELKPGGLHIMLLEVTKPLAEGDEVTITLNFANGEKETLTVPVKKVIKGMKK